MLKTKKLAISDKKRYHNYMAKVNLEHYSPKQGLKEISPSFQGKGADSRTHGRASEHPHSFYYRKGTSLPQEDSHIHQAAKSKYEIEIPEDTKLYDLGLDPEGHIKSLKEQALHKSTNPNVVTMDDIHSALKEKGFHGFFNSQHPSLSNVVGLYHSQPVLREEKLR
jgi:hypothetical protein